MSRREIKVFQESSIRRYVEDAIDASERGDNEEKVMHLTCLAGYLAACFDIPLPDDPRRKAYNADRAVRLPATTPLTREREKAR